MVDGRKTLIVGGGIAGLTLAAALHRQGFEVSLIGQCMAAHLAREPERAGDAPPSPAASGDCSGN